MKIYRFLALCFNCEPDVNGVVFTKDSVNEEELIKLRNSGNIHSYEILEDGLYISMEVKKD